MEWVKGKGGVKGSRSRATEEFVKSHPGCPTGKVEKRLREIRHFVKAWQHRQLNVLNELYGRPKIRITSRIDS